MTAWCFLALQSQVVLHDVADYDLRKRKLESLKDRLEALLSPKLVAAFNSHSLGESALLVCFSLVGMLSEGRLGSRGRRGGIQYRKHVHLLRDVSSFKFLLACLLLCRGGKVLCQHICGHGSPVATSVIL